jgi:cytidyltransferase-like protein
LHLGHIRHLEAAKQHGEWLIVTVTPDRFVNKGPHRPAFTAAQRAEALMALREVDEVQITESPTAADAIRQIRPAVFAKGPDYDAENLHPDEAQAIAEVGAKLVITDTQKWSSTALLRESNPYLDGLRATYSAADVFGWLDRASTLRVLVVGDAIRDEYVYCDTLGKSGKDPMLAAQFVRAEAFPGGVDAVAHHVGAVADAVDVLTGPTTVKRRFIEQYPFQKLFEVYEMDERAANDETPRLLETLPGHLQSADLVIVADYGHGLLTPPVIELLTDRARQLAVNTQANAGNHGFNTISKYRRASFVSLSEREIRLDARNQQTRLEYLMQRLARRVDGSVVVTRGEKGAWATDGMVCNSAPALTTHAVDRTGAGDAVFAVTACCAAVGMPLDLIAFMASVVGTMAVGIVGNARYIERKSLRAAVESYL